MRRYAHQSWSSGLGPVLRVCAAVTPRESPSLTLALTRFSCLHSACGAIGPRQRLAASLTTGDSGLAVRVRRAAISALQPCRTPPLGFGYPCDGLLPIVPCGGRRIPPRRSRDSPFGACPRPDRCRSPGPGPPAVPWWRSMRPLRVRFRASCPGRSSSRSWIDPLVLPWDFPLGLSPAPPWLSVFVPRHPPARFEHCHLAAFNTLHLGVLRNSAIGWPFPAAGPYGFFDL